jgi:ABC-type multidrug transport system ATPase subunit
LADLMIDAQGVSHRYGARWALRGVDLRLAKGKILAMVGANGSGKTTLLKSLAGLIQVTSGSVKVFGMDSFSHRVAIMRHARFSFSPPSLYDSLTAYEHLMFLTRMGVAPGLRPTCKEMMGVLKLVGHGGSGR